MRKIDSKTSHAALKGVAINGYSIDEIAFIEEWCNTLSRKLLNYRTSEEPFEDELDAVYAV